MKNICWKMTKKRCEKLFYDCVSCVCLQLGTTFLAVAFFIAIGFLMGVMIISFALSIDLYQSLWNS